MFIPLKQYEHPLQFMNGSKGRYRANWGLSCVVASLLFIAYLLRAADVYGGNPDFGVYWTAAKTVLAGENPYHIDNLRNHNPENWLAWLYPLTTVYIFVPFTLLSLPVAATVYALIKSVAIGALIAVWQRDFLPEPENRREWLVTAGVLLFGGAATFYVDLRNGNVASFEQLFLWLGFACYIRRRFALFCACVVMAASFKFILASALCLLLFADTRHRKPLFYGTVATLAAWLGVSYLLNPAWFGDYVGAASAQSRGTGLDNATLLSIVRELPLPHMMQSPVYLVIALCLVAVCALQVRRASAVERVLLFSIGFAMVTPRLSVYSYIIVLPALCHLALAWYREPPQWVAPVLLIAVPFVLGTPYIMGSPLHGLSTWVSNYFLYLMTAGCFAQWCVRLKGYAPADSGNVSTRYAQSCEASAVAYRPASQVSPA